MKVQELIEALQGLPRNLEVHTFVKDVELGNALLEVEKADIVHSDYFGDIVVLELEVV